jgi:serine/threonine protein kinase
MTPEKIGRYEVVRELGRGGMAVVYLAQDPYMKRQVAVKVLPRQFTFDEQFRARFEREAQVIAALEHPSIVPVYDFGEHDGQPYIVMRFMPGGSLADLLRRRGALTISDAARVFQHIAGALDEAHRKGIVHRDLKPGNILFDSRGYPAIADFGIVKVSEATANYTGSALIGTPGYMSPEQAKGDSEIDARSDIYALGTILFEMLTGQLPYKSDTPMGIVMKHILDPVPSILEAKPDLPAGCELVISKALAKERDKRYNTTSEMARALTQVAAETPGSGIATMSPTEALTSPPKMTPIATPVPSGTGSLPAPDTNVIEAASKVSDSQFIAVPAASPSRPLFQRLLPVFGCLGLLACGFLLMFTVLSLGDDEDDLTPTPEIAQVTPTSETVTEEAPAATASPTAPTSDNVTANFIGRQSDAFGISLAAPDNWYFEDTAGYVAVASDEGVISDEVEITEGGVVYVFADSLEDIGVIDPVAMLQLAAPNLELSADAAIVEQPSPLTISGQPAAIAAIRGTTDEAGTPYLALISLIIHEERFAIAVGATPEESISTYRPVLEAIINTIEVTEPSGGADLQGYLEYGETVNGGVDNEGAVVQWGISGQRNDILDVTVLPLDSDFDLVVDVWDATGASILRGGPVDRSLGEETIERLRLPEEGDYFIVIYGYNESTGDYELTVEESQSSG